MITEKRKKGIITVFALLLAAFIAGGVFSVSAKYTSKLSTANTYVQVGLKLDPNYESAADSQWRMVSPVNGQAMPSVTPPARDGYIFTGYYTTDGTAGHEQNDGNRYYKNDGTSYKNWDASCNVLYAGWEGSFRITFDAETNGGTIKDSTETQTSLYAKNGAKTLYTERNAVVTAATPLAEHSEKEHYYFDGWYTSAVGGIKKVEYDGTVLSDWTGLTDDSTVLYAQYKPYTYVLSFNKNGANGTEIMPDQDDNKTYLDTITLEENLYTDSRYKYVGWMGNESGTSVQFEDKASMTIAYMLSNGATAVDTSDYTKKKITLYARWERYLVEFDATSSGIIGTSGQTKNLYVNKGQSLFYVSKEVNNEVQADAPSASYTGASSGYYFAGWYTGSGTTGDKVIETDGTIQYVSGYTDADGKWDFTGDSITLYAHYKHHYKVTFDAGTNGGYISGTNPRASTKVLWEFNGLLYNTAECNPGDTAEIPYSSHNKRTSESVCYWCNTSAVNSNTRLVVNNGTVVSSISGYTDSSGKWDDSSWPDGGITLYCLWYTVNYYKDTGAITDTAYTELQYTASTGSQTLDTGIKPGSYGTNFQIIFTMRPSEVNANQYFYWTKPYNGILAERKLAFYCISNGRAGWDSGNDTGIGQHVINSGDSYTVDVTYTPFKKSYVFNYVRIMAISNNYPWLNNSEQQGSIESGSNLLFFGGNDSNSKSKIRLYYLELYGNGSLVRNYVPAMRNSDGRIGLYNKAGSGNAFYDNENSSTVNFITEAYNQVFAYGETTGLLNGYNVTGNAADGLLKEGYTNNGAALIGWSFTRTPDIKEVSFTTDQEVPNLMSAFNGKIVGTAGNLHVDLYTCWQPLTLTSKAVFRSPNKDIEYVYVEPVNKEDGDIIEEENINE